MKALMCSNFGQIPPPTPESEKLMYNVESTLAPSFLIRSSSFLQVTSLRTTITSQTSSKFGQIGPRTAELASL